MTFIRYDELLLFFFFLFFFFVCFVGLFLEY